MCNLMLETRYSRDIEHGGEDRVLCDAALPKLEPPASALGKTCVSGGQHRTQAAEDTF